MKKSSNAKTFIIMTVLLIGMGFIVFFASQQGKGGIFDLRNRASAPGNIVTISQQPPSGTTHYVGDIFPIDLSISTNTKYISAIAMELSYPYGSDIDIVDPTTGAHVTQIKDLSKQLDPSFSQSVNSVTTAQDPITRINTTYIDYATTTTLASGYINTAPTTFARIWVKALLPTSKTIVSNVNKSIVTEKVTAGGATSNLDVLQDIPQYTISVVKSTTAPTVTIQGDFGSTPVTATASSVTFSWSGVAQPARPAGTLPVPLQYSYQFDSQTWSTYSSATSITKTLTNGNHTFQVRAKDPSGNVSTPTSPDSKRSFTLNLTPFISSINPDNGTSGTVVTIDGYNFGATQGTSKVYFGTTAASTYSKWSDTEIKVAAPAGANGDMYVQVGTLKSNKLTFAIGTMLKLIVKLEGIASDVGIRQASISVKSSSSNSAVLRFPAANAKFNGNGTYAVIVGPLDPFTAGNYNISIKDASHLRKRWTSVALSKNIMNVVTKTGSTDTVLLGDLNGDNVFDIQDIGAMLNVYTALSVPATGNLAPFDLDGDGTIDISDVSLLLSKYKQLQILGDQE